ncbi:MAG: hypothetical protein ACOC4B_00610 [Bacteroidota bacterium]
MIHLHENVHSFTVSKKNETDNDLIQYYAMLVLLILVTACQENPGDRSSNDSSDPDKQDKASSNVVNQIIGDHAETDSELLRVAFPGNGEPEPLTEFPNMADAVNQINSIPELQKVDL